MRSISVPYWTPREAIQIISRGLSHGLNNFVTQSEKILDTSSNIFTITFVFLRFYLYCASSYLGFIGSCLKFCKMLLRREIYNNSNYLGLEKISRLKIGKAEYEMFESHNVLGIGTKDSNVNPIDIVCRRWPSVVEKQKTQWAWVALLCRLLQLHPFGICNS